VRVFTKPWLQRLQLQAHKVSTAQELYVAVLQEHHGHNTAVAAVGLALELLDAVHEVGFCLLDLMPPALLARSRH
jgi:hypothetical protein